MNQDFSQTRNRLKDIRPRELAGMVDKILSAHAGGRPLNIASHTPAKWVTAAEYLFRAGQLEATEYASRHLLAAYPNLRWANLVCRFSDHLPPAGNQLPFSDEETKDVQVVPRAGSDTVILLFCDVRHHLNMPLVAAHRWFGALPASLIYLRDFHHHLFAAGIASLGTDRLSTLSSLQSIVTSLGARRILCFGNSSGVFPALHYGLHLGARAVLGMAGPVTLSRAFHSQSPALAVVSAVGKKYPDISDLDMREAYGKAQSPPAVRLVFGGDAPDDRRHAEHMKTLPGVVLHQLDGYGGHDAMIESVSRGLLPSMLDWLMQQE